ncbi:hypothetical protein [Actinomadura sp. 9N407]|uniref:hypothetical protein n=1 Tax=Actinomadura sp. 9N407 TaxID=3375154 RepID=UPI0037B1EB8E
MSFRSALAALGVVPLALAAPLAAALVPPDASLEILAAARGGLGLRDGQSGDFLRAAGLGLPALLPAVPLAAVAARRYSARAVLLVGLFLLIAGLVAVRLADAVPQIAAGRLAQGAGAGIALSATVVLVWERGSRFLVALWAGALAGGLLVAMPLVLYVVPREADWRAALAPFPWPALVALAAALLCLWRPDVASETRRSGAPRQEGSQVVLPVVPAACLAFLAVAASYAWSPGALTVVACIALVSLLGLAVAAGRDPSTSSPLGCAVVMVTAGLLAYPLAGPPAGLAAVNGSVPVAPFLAGGAAALAGALVTVRMSADMARRAVPAGHVLIVVAVLAGLGTPGSPLSMVPLGLGVGMALAASLRDAGVGAALFGLGLCFPAVLTGQLLVLSLQAGQWHRASPGTAAERLSALSTGYRDWLVAAGVIAVLLAVASWRRRGAAPDGAAAERDTGGGSAAEALPEPLSG